jgi:DmsE family decaheme c-type cytochrome
MGMNATAQAASAAKNPDLVLNGDAKCTKCHDEGDSPKVLLIGQTRHGVNADGRTPTCTSCHGASEAHLKGAGKGSGETPMPDITFGAKSKSSAEERSNACLNCHQKDAKRMFWMGSQHQARDITCSSCHQVHAAQDKVRDKVTQPEVCFTCHKEQRALSNKPSHHPIPEGKMACSDCHSPHGSSGPKQLVKDSVNATCYTCHAEKRGPFIHSHQPVTDDCVNCHNPHGTTADYMLKTRAPFLCLGCHDPSSHPGNVPGIAGNVDMSKNRAGTVLSASAPIDNNNTSGVVGKTQGLSCMNCHTDIHGSNNPINSTRALRFWR